MSIQSAHDDATRPMSRLLPLRPEELTPEQQAAHEEMAKGRRAGRDGQFGGPFDPWVRSPEVAKRMVGFGGFLWARTTIGRRIVELAILVTGRFWESNVEWWAHAPMALEAGVSQQTIDDIFAQRRPTNAPADEVLAHDVSRALHETHQLPQDLYDAAVATFGEQGLVELIATIGYYTTVSMTLNAFEVGLPAGQEPPFPR